MMNYEKDIGIDENALDVEFVRHPLKFLKYAEHLAHTEKVTKRAHENLKTIKAKLSNQALSDPTLCAGGKATAVAIEAYYRTNEKYLEAKESWVETEYEKDMALNAVQAMNAKKTSLENLVRLHGQQYFAGPSVPRDLAQEMEQRTSVVNTRRKRAK